MAEALYSIDKWCFHFINASLSNPVFDAVMPPLTDWNKSWIGLGLFGVLWLLLMIKGGRKGRLVGGTLVLLILVSDQFSSQVLKHLFSRPRPCHVPLEGLRLLVDCGSGYSFPSSHAVNNSAFAFYMSYHYRRWWWMYTIYASLMCLSRIIVGVHYPSDVLGGAVIGVVLAALLIFAQNALAKRIPTLRTDV